MIHRSSGARVFRRFFSYFEIKSQNQRYLPVLCLNDYCKIVAVYYIYCSDMSVYDLNTQTFYSICITIVFES